MEGPNVETPDTGRGDLRTVNRARASPPVPEEDRNRR